MDERTNFITLDRTFLENMKYLSPATVMIWIEFKSYWWVKKDGKPYNKFVMISYETIKKWTGINSNHTIQKSIQELYILGFIVKIERRFNQTPKYYLDNSPEITEERLDKLNEFKGQYSKARNKWNFERLIPVNNSNENIHDVGNENNNNDGWG